VGDFHNSAVASGLPEESLSSTFDSLLEGQSDEVGTSDSARGPLNVAFASFEGCVGRPLSAMDEEENERTGLVGHVQSGDNLWHFDCRHRDRQAADSNEYADVEWNRPSLRGYTRSKSSALKTSWVLDYRCRIDNKDGEEYWLCRECHRRKDHRKHLYRAGDQTTGGATHLKNVHGTVNGGLIAGIKHSQASGRQKLVGQQIGKKCKTADYFQLPQGTLAAVVNALAEMFNIHEFRSLLLRRIVFDHIPFKKVESDAFKALLLFCNPLLAAELPSARTVSRWINSAFNGVQGVVTELLATALGLVHFSFDMWTSGNSLVAKAVMIGGGSCSEPYMDVFEQQLESLARDEREQLAQWRRRGPVGKLHNIVVWIYRSPQRIEMFESLQRKAIDEGSQFTEQIYRLVHDNDTRWNRLFVMTERALKLRELIVEYIFKETTK
jgi:hypothetical protein